MWIWRYDRYIGIREGGLSKTTTQFFTECNLGLIEGSESAIKYSLLCS